MTKILAATQITTAIGNLLTIATIAARFRISEETVRELTQSGFMPHYRVQGFDEPLFKSVETKQWIAANLIEHHKGSRLPKPEFIVVSDFGTALARNIPSVLATVDNLKELRSEAFCGVYFLCLGDKVVYVGQSTNVVSRAAAHRRGKEFDRVLFLRIPPSQLLEIETQFIQALNPPLNKTYQPVEEVAA